MRSPSGSGSGSFVAQAALPSSLQITIGFPFFVPPTEHESGSRSRAPRGRRLVTRWPPRRAQTLRRSPPTVCSLFSWQHATHSLTTFPVFRFLHQSSFGLPQGYLDSPCKLTYAVCAVAARRCCSVACSRPLAAPPRPGGGGSRADSISRTLGRNAGRGAQAAPRAQPGGAASHALAGGPAAPPRRVRCPRDAGAASAS